MSQTPTPFNHPDGELSCRARDHCSSYLKRLIGSVSTETERACERIASHLVCATEYKLPRFDGTLNSEPANLSSGPLVEELLSAHGAKPVWPHGKTFALCLTHDVDYLRATCHLERFRALRSIREASFKNRVSLCAGVFNHGLRAMMTGIQFYPLDMWLRAEDEFGFRSTFYFMAGPPARPDSCDIYYRLEDEVLLNGRRRPLRDVLPSLVAGGWEVGMHGSIASAFDVEIARTERLRLCESAKTEVISGRQHYLNYDIRKTPLVHEAAGLRTDSTLGANFLPVCYRIGTGLPFPMFHLLSDRPLNLIQIPLITQDNPLLSAANGNIDRAIEIMTALLKTAADQGGMITLLFHPNYAENSVAFQTYRQILAIASDLGAWGCTSGDAARWFLERSYCGSKVAA